MVIFLFFLSFIFCLHKPQPLVVLSDTVLTDVDFYEQVSKDDWVSFDIDKKIKVFDDFLKNELGYYHALQKKVHLHPLTVSALYVRKKQVLLNNSYEHLVARPLIKKQEVEKNTQNLKRKVEAYHLLVGYKGSEQDTESLISQKRGKGVNR